MSILNKRIGKALTQRSFILPWSYAMGQGD